jgi:hypothetical protein
LKCLLSPWLRFAHRCDMITQIHARKIKSVSFKNGNYEYVTEWISKSINFVKILSLNCPTHKYYNIIDLLTNNHNDNDFTLLLGMSKWKFFLIDYLIALVEEYSIIRSFFPLLR